MTEAEIGDVIEYDTGFTKEGIGLVTGMSNGQYSVKTFTGSDLVRKTAIIRVLDVIYPPQTLSIKERLERA